MTSPIQEFLNALDLEEAKHHEKLAQDRAGILLRASINEFDWYHHNFAAQDSPTTEEAEHYYFCRLGLVRSIRLAYQAVDRYTYPVVTFARRSDISLAALELLGAIGMIEHGRRVAHIAKTGLGQVHQVDGRTFRIVLPSAIVDEEHHERALFAYYSSEHKRIFDSAFSRVLTEETIRSIASKLDELVYVYRDKFIGYNAHPLLDDYFFGLAHSGIWRQEGFDTFHFATEFGGIPFHKYILATTFFVSLAMKHRGFCGALVKKAPHIRLENIITVSAEWRDLMIETAEALNTYGTRFEGYTHTSVEDAESIASVLSLSRDNVGMVNRPHSPLPYLIRTSDSGVVKLLAGADAEPIQFLLHSLRHHFPREYDRNQQQRERSFRRAIERVLNGCFPGLEFRNNIKIRQGGKTLTDIDLAVIDPVTGSIILCQLKYQDLYGADILSGASRRRHLKSGTRDWLHVVHEWHKRIGVTGLRSSLRLDKKFKFRRVYFLVLSKHFAYPLKDVQTGFPFTYSNWLQLVNVLTLMEKKQGDLRTIVGMINLLNEQNSQAPEVEYVEEPTTKYAVGELEFTVSTTTG